MYKFCAEVHHLLWFDWRSVILMKLRLSNNDLNKVREHRRHNLDI